MTQRYFNGPSPSGVDAVMAQEPIVTQGQAGSSNWDLTDNLGTLRYMVSDGSAAVDHVIADAFGDTVSETNPSVAHWTGFAGGHVDPGTGDVIDGERSYDPSTGNWTTKDPIGFKGGDPNTNRYADNSPRNGVDSNGEEVTWPATAAMVFFPWTAPMILMAQMQREGNQAMQAQMDAGRAEGQQLMMAQQQAMMAQQQAMAMQQQQAMLAPQQAMLGQQQGMMAQQQALVVQQQQQIQQMAQGMAGAAAAAGAAIANSGTAGGAASGAIIGGISGAAGAALGATAVIIIGAALAGTAPVWAGIGTVIIVGAVGGVIIGGLTGSVFGGAQPGFVNGAIAAAEDPATWIAPFIWGLGAGVFGQMSQNPPGGPPDVGIFDPDNMLGPPPQQFPGLPNQGPQPF